MKTFKEYINRRGFLGNFGKAIGGLALGSVLNTPQSAQTAEQMVMKWTDDEIIAMARRIQDKLKQVGVTEEDIVNMRWASRKAFHYRDLQNPKYKKFYENWKKNYLEKERARLGEMWEDVKNDEKLDNTEKQKWSDAIKEMWQAAQQHAEAPDLASMTQGENVDFLTLRYIEKHHRAIESLAILMAYVKKGGEL